MVNFFSDERAERRARFESRVDPRNSPDDYDEGVYYSTLARELGQTGGERFGATKKKSIL